MLRSVVWPISDVARTYSSTLTTASSGSTTRKYTTALTLTVTLSRVMASWAGTSRVTMRRSTLRIRSTPGMRKNSPGPRAPTRRPRRKMTPRSYSCTILIVELSRTSASTTMATRTIMMVGITLAPPVFSLPTRHENSSSCRRGRVVTADGSTQRHRCNSRDNQQPGRPTYRRFVQRLVFEQSRGQPIQLTPVRLEQTRRFAGGFLQQTLDLGIDRVGRCRTIRLAPTKSEVFQASAGGSISRRECDRPELLAHAPARDHLTCQVG